MLIAVSVLLVSLNNHTLALFRLVKLAAVHVQLRWGEQNIR